MSSALHYCIGYVPVVLFLILSHNFGAPFCAHLVNLSRPLAAYRYGVNVDHDDNALLYDEESAIDTEEEEEEEEVDI